MGAGFDVAINYGYTERAMDVSIAEAKNRLPELIRAVEQGEVVITRHGKPVAQIAPLHSATFQALPSSQRTVRR